MQRINSLRASDATGMLGSEGSLKRSSSEDDNSVAKSGKFDDILIESIEDTRYQLEGDLN